MRRPSAVFNELRQPGRWNSLTFQDVRIFAASINGPGLEASKQGSRFKTEDIVCDDSKGQDRLAVIMREKK
jgi:hypothetical protein